MITNFYIISESGANLFHKDYEDRKVEPSLLSGFISAISHFADAIGEGSIKSMNIANRKWLYITEQNLITLCIANQNDDEEIIKIHFLTPLIAQFLNDYKQELASYSGEVDKFKDFYPFVNSQLEVYKAQAAENTSIFNNSQALSINGVIEMFGMENLCLMLRHAANHRLILIGDDLIIQKVGALIQSMIPIQITSEINEYTDLYLASSYPNNSRVDISTFNLMNQGWTNQIFVKAEYEKNLLKETLKKKNMGDMDKILLFRNKYLELTGKITEYINTIWKYKDNSGLLKHLQQIVKDKNEIEFLHGYIKKNVGLDVNDYIEESKRSKK